MNYGRRNDTMKKTFFAALLAAFVLAFTVPAAAETFTASNGVVSIDLPNENWKEMVDPTKWIALSDGANLITIEHFSNGEKLPDMSVADDYYVNVYQAVFSTQNEVFVITGSVMDNKKIPDVANAIASAKVLKYDTKVKLKDEKKDKVSVSDFSLKSVDKTQYVTVDGLNVRNACSTSAQIIGGFVYGAAVKVTGIVQQNDKDFGWVQVDYNGTSGYVSSAYLSDKAPEAKKEKKDTKETKEGKDTKDTKEQEQNDITFTGTAMTIFDEDGDALTIYKATDGVWYDSAGLNYIWLTENTLSSSAGKTFTIYQPVNSDSSDLTVAGDSITVWWLNGNTEILTPYSDGSYYSSDWVQYWYAGGGAYAGADGTTLYSSEPQLGNSDEEEENHGLVSQGSGRPVEIFEGGGAFYDEEGMEYYRQDDGTFIDENGDVFNQEW